MALLLTKGRMSDHRGATLLLPALPPSRELFGGRSHDSNRFRVALIERGITPCIPSTCSRKVALPYDKVLYQQWHWIENAFGQLKDWRRIAMRYD